MTGTYKEAEKTIKEILKTHSRNEKNTNRQAQRTNNKEIKEAREIKKEMCDKFHTAWKSGSEGNKIATKKEYLESQKKLRNLIEEAETKRIEERLKKVQEKAKINPNAIWDARKKPKDATD